MNTASPGSSTRQIPLQLLASRYGYAALLDEEGNEQPITPSMISSACDEVMDAIYSLLPQHMQAMKQHRFSIHAD